MIDPTRLLSLAPARASVLRGRFSAIPPARQGADRQRDASDKTVLVLRLAYSGVPYKAYFESGKPRHCDRAHIHRRQVVVAANV
jgi:hypothetical protein